MNGIVTWLAGLQGAGNETPLGRGVEVALVPTRSMPLWVWGLVAAAVGLWVGWSYRHARRELRGGRRTCLMLLRLGSVGLVWALWPGWTLQSYRTELPELIVVLDDSASMGLVDPLDPVEERAARAELAAAGLSEPTRLDLARALWLKRGGRWLQELGQRYRVRLFRAGKTLRPLDDEEGELRTWLTALRELTAAEPASRLGDCLAELLQWQRGRATAAVVLLSDGIVTDGLSLEEAARLARSQGVPVYTIALGSDRPPRDLRLTDLVVDETVLVNDWIVFEAKLVAGGLPGAAVVQLRQRDEAQVLAEQRLTLRGEEQVVPVRLLYRAPAPGTFDYVLEVVPQEGEVDVENNRLTARVTVKEATLRVLLVQGYPSYEFRFLKQMLLRELDPDPAGPGKSPAVHTVLQEADLAYAETDRTALRTLPTRREELFQYDVILWGDVNPAQLSPRTLDYLVEFVTERGGGLVLLAGPRYLPRAYRGTPLERLLPAPGEQMHLPELPPEGLPPLRPALTPLGQASPWLQLTDDPEQHASLWRQELPPLYWFLRLETLRPGVRVLAAHPTQHNAQGQPLPLICLQFVGAGKVLFHATDETYRWRFRTGDAYFARYWLQAIRYLSRASLLGSPQRVELRSDRSRYLAGETVNLRLRFFDDRQAPPDEAESTLAIETPDGQRRLVRLQREGLERGWFAGSVSGLSEGTYRAWLLTPPLDGPPPQCTFQVVAPPGELARTRTDRAALQRLAEHTGGRAVVWTEAERVLARLPPGRQVRIEPLPPRPVWNHPVVGLLLVGLLTAEWLLRRRSGLE